VRSSDRVRRAGLRAAARVGRTRRPVTGVPEEWPSPSSGGNAWDGTEPGLHAVWRRLLVDRSADRIGISAVFGGQPCGSPISVLPVKKDPVASPIVWSTRWFAAVTQYRE
jgi:hypothetical protein